MVREGDVSVFFFGRDLGIYFLEIWRGLVEDEVLLVLVRVVVMDVGFFLEE